QPSRVDRHADDRVDAHRVEGVDLLLRGDAASRDERPRRRLAHRADGVEIGALHQPFTVDVRVEELGAERFELSDRFDGGDRHGLTPALHRDAPALRVDGRDDAVGAHRIGEPCGELEVGATVLEERRPDDHVRGALIENRARALDRADAAADATRTPRADVLHERVVVAGADGGVEVDELQLRVAFEPPQPAVEVIVFEREALSLDELDDLAVAEIDCGYQHSVTLVPGSRQQAAGSWQLAAGSWQWARGRSPPRSSKAAAIRQGRRAIGPDPTS